MAAAVRISRPRRRRNFIDFDGDHVPDCNMLQQDPNGECISPLGNFANPNTLTLVNPDCSCSR
jgi:hypothetical protein